MHRLVTTACKDEQGLRLSRTLLLMHLPLGVFRMECLCIFGKNSKRRPFGSTEQHFFSGWIDHLSLLPGSRTFVPIPRRARGIPRGNTRWESNRCWWADTRMRQCLKDVFLACLVCFISAMMLSRTDKGNQSLTRENNHWLTYQPTRPYCTWLFSVYCSYESDPLLDALGCFWMLLKALGNMLQPDKHFPWATRLGGPSIFFVYRLLLLPTWQIPCGKPPQPFPFPSLPQFSHFIQSDKWYFGQYR